MSFLDMVKPKEKENVPPDLVIKASRRKSKKKHRSTMKDSRSSSDGSKSYQSFLQENPTSTRPRFSQLNNEIVQFQGMVRQLEPLVKSSGSTPQDQWKARILLRSAEEADQGIGNNMKHHEQSIRNVNDPIVRASYQKLNRDYRRAHDSFIGLSNQYNGYQQEAVAQLGGNQGWLSPEEVQRKMLAKQEEDFFVRAMREREEEIKSMNQSMHQVKDIYSELGRIVQNQQEQINQVEYHIEDGKEYTRASLNQLQRKFPYCGAPSVDDETRDAPPRYITEEEFHWTLPFQTLGEDMKEVVQKDILGLGKDIISMTRPRNLFRTKIMLQCASEGVAVD